MPEYVYYDRRNVNATVVQFFHESTVKHTDKEFGTNMEMDAMFPVSFSVSKIVVDVPAVVLSSTTARDTGILTEVNRVLTDMIVEIGVGDRPIIRLPLSELLSSGYVFGDVEYTLATAGDGSYGVACIAKNATEHGFNISIAIPANTMFKFFIKSKTTPALGVVTVKLIGERG